ncbi:unnamed protein product [Pleuronectes platessa]|uniref:Uncharacterized protein n=1 Tax=Pleuronectes platessa TaxID=8262 RepID=A0A9N7U221_PLEPL|nr:unnamed protein product [Pleuronectes platessa]
MLQPATRGRSICFGFEEMVVELPLEGANWGPVSCSRTLTHGEVELGCELPTLHLGGNLSPVINQAVRRRFSGPLQLPPLHRRHSSQEHSYDTRRLSAAHGLPLERLEVLYSRALASHDEHRSVYMMTSLALTLLLASGGHWGNCFYQIS